MVDTDLSLALPHVQFLLSHTSLIVRHAGLRLKKSWFNSILLLQRPLLLLFSGFHFFTLPRLLFFSICISCVHAHLSLLFKEFNPNGFHIILNCISSWKWNWEMYGLPLTPMKVAGFGDLKWNEWNCGCLPYSHCDYK